ncbi:hypothetical protein EVG20_g10201, partial [Dentipellis fragilis]
MPRNHNAGPSTLRNRNRVTNKTRLRIHRDNIDADSLTFDEDEEKARVVSTAGVDAEDANEHHLQAVLSAASQRQHTALQRATRGADEKKAQDAYIPIPDSTGMVDNYEEYYPAGRWKDPFSYVKTSETVEEAVKDGLAHGFTYFMDERDKEWLDKNNEEARGEGTSAQGALSSSGTTTRSGQQRSAKSKGKEPDVRQPVAMSEDEFELVMGLFEKVTHQKTEFLHHGLEQGAPFPPFSDYQDTFANSLPVDTFAAFAVPAWVPTPPQMLRFAKAVYPYWRERRIERQGHAIIPMLNYDEADTRNESYICFRRREVKAMRKTRASQASSSEKLMRLQSELATALDLVNLVKARETLKREVAQQGRNVWDKREELANLKRKFPSLGAKEDEELFYDKERVAKKPKVEVPTRIGLKIRREHGEGSPAMQQEAPIRPKERQAMIAQMVERDLARIRDKDHHWEDSIDNGYQSQPVPFAQRHWKYIPPVLSPSKRSSPSDSEPEESPKQWHAVRMRRGRGGVLRMDRRVHRSRLTPDDEDVIRPPRLFGQAPSEEEQAEVRELSDRIRERWLFDSDDEPPVGPDGSEEENRTLIDEYDPKVLRKTMSLYRDEDPIRLMTDHKLYFTYTDGRQEIITPYKLNAHPVVRRDNVYANQRPTPPPAAAQQPAAGQPQRQQSMHPPAVALSMPQTNGTPISMQAQLKKMQPPMNVPQMRISNNGGMRPSSTLTVGVPLQPVASSSQVSPPIVSPTVPLNGHTATNGIEHESKPIATSSAAPDNAVQPNGSPATSTTSVSAPMQLKPPNPHHAMNMPNGYAINGYNHLQL